MPFSIPTLADLRSQNRANFAARLPGAATWLRHAVIPILADLCAYPLYAAYRALVWISQQMFTDSAEAPYLDRMGADYGILRVSAVPAVLVATASFTQPATIPAGTAVSSSDFTQTYTVTTAITATGAGTLPVTVTGATPGAAANQADGAILILQVAIAGVQAQMTVTGTTTAGTDAESDASLRARISGSARGIPAFRRERGFFRKIAGSAPATWRSRWTPRRRIFRPRRRSPPCRPRSPRPRR